MSPDLSNALRAETPTAPDALRHRIALIASEPPTPRRVLPLRRVLMVAAPAAAAASLVAAVAVGVKAGVEHQPSREAVANELAPKAPSGGLPIPRSAVRTVAPDAFAPAVAAPARKRAQDVRTSITLLVDDTDDLSATTQRALRITRSLGGYVQTVNFGSETAEGTAALQVRIPVSRVQAAVVRFSGLGRILAQQTQITDLQQRLDELTRQIRRAGDPRIRAALRRERIELHRRAAYATLSLDLTTHEPQQQAAPPSRIDRAVNDATGVLTGELAVIAYALIVASPFLVLLAAAYAGRRAYRRYSDLRLLERA
ncbi:MAG TPA: DUF4349 domain-containing protein [Gaiellaceae bacterium]